jgi:SRSO17 transposase
VEPMAAMTAPARVSAQHQKLLHFVANAEWSDEQMLAKVRHLVTPSIMRQGPIEAWIIDDTSFPKKGQHSVGVHHQYCGKLGKQANCRVAATLSIANHHGSLPIAYQLCLPRAWTDDRSRLAKVHVPRSIRFKTKPQIALEQIRAALKASVAPGVVLMDVSRGASASKPWHSACPSTPGASSAIIRSSSGKSASATMRGAHGEAFIITARCRSQPTGSSGNRVKSCVTRG